MNALHVFRCRYSQALKPIFDKTAESLHNEHPVSVLGVAMLLTYAVT